MARTFCSGARLSPPFLGGLPNCLRSPASSGACGTLWPQDSYVSQLLLPAAELGLLLVQPQFHDSWEHIKNYNCLPISKGMKPLLSSSSPLLLSFLKRQELHCRLGWAATGVTGWAGLPLRHFRWAVVILGVPCGHHRCSQSSPHARGPGCCRGRSVGQKAERVVVRVHRGQIPPSPPSASTWGPWGATADPGKHLVLLVRPLYSLNLFYWLRCFYRRWLCLSEKLYHWSSFLSDFYGCFHI